MKLLPLLIIHIVIAHGVFAQDGKVKFIDSVANSVRPWKQTFTLFEKIDTVDDHTGRRYKLNRYYYFDKAEKKLRSVNAYENQDSHHAGIQLLYTFYNNELIKVKLIPPRNQCRSCSGEYYFSEGILLLRKESNLAPQDVSIFIRDAVLFRSKMPDHFE